MLEQPALKGMKEKEFTMIDMHTLQSGNIAHLRSFNTA